ncbi:hypothetical protein DXG01_006621 [Tephrocybe rancida]|nr:hypothetical protein DXG01_006621 [Tephrocybe rancida]
MLGLSFFSSPSSADAPSALAVGFACPPVHACQPTMPGSLCPSCDNIAYQKEKEAAWYLKSMFDLQAKIVELMGGQLDAKKAWQAEVRRKDKEIEDLKAEVARRDAEMVKERLEREVVVMDLEEELEKRDAEVVVLKTGLASRDRDVGVVKAELGRKETAIRHLEESLEREKVKEEYLEDLVAPVAPQPLARNITQPIQNQGQNPWVPTVKQEFPAAWPIQTQAAYIPAAKRQPIAPVAVAPQPFARPAQTQFSEFESESGDSDSEAAAATGKVAYQQGAQIKYDTRGYIRPVYSRVPVCTSPDKRHLFSGKGTNGYMRKFTCKLCGWYGSESV